MRGPKEAEEPHITSADAALVFCWAITYLFPGIYCSKPNGLFKYTLCLLPLVLFIPFPPPFFNVLPVDSDIGDT
jgi:hypothetical protein